MNNYTSVLDGYNSRQQTHTLQAPVYQQTQTFAQPMGRPSINKRQKIVEVIVEKPVIVHRYVDVPEEIIIEKPVERRIEQEVYTERVIEIPVERIVENEVEVIREEIREFITEREVEFERYVDIPVERYVEKPVEVIREVDVRVPVHVDKVVDRTYIRPIETRVVEHPVYVDRQVVQDRYVDKHVEVPYDRVVERVQERFINKEYFTEVERVIKVDKVVEVPVERPYDVVVEKIFNREVEVPIKVDKYVDRPYEVLKEVVREVPREYVRENRVTIAVDKYVDVPVERVVEIPVRQETHMEVIYEVQTERAVFDAATLDIPFPVIVDKPIQVDNIVEAPVERVVDRVVEVPFGRVVERGVPRELAVEVFRINEVAQYVDRTVDVPVGVEKYIEVPREEIVEKTINIQKIIEKPVVIPRYIDRYVDKIVDVKVEVVVPKVIEVPRQNFIDKVVDLTTRVQRINYRERQQQVPINTILKKNTISALQKRRFHESSVQLANIVVENAKITAELTSLRERGGVRGGLSGVNASAQENERLRRLVLELESSLRQKETERNRLRQTTSTTGDIEVIQQVDSSDVPRLQAHIQRVRAENENLRRISQRGQFTSNRRQVGTRVSHQDTRRETAVHLPTTTHTGVRSVSAGLTEVRRSAGYATTGVVRTSGSGLPTVAQGGAIVRNSGVTGGYTTGVTGGYTTGVAQGYSGATGYTTGVSTLGGAGVVRRSAGYSTTLTTGGQVLQGGSYVQGSGLPTVSQGGAVVRTSGTTGGYTTGGYTTGVTQGYSGATTGGVVRTSGTQLTTSTYPTTTTGGYVTRQ
jgi:hypothetical protein